MHKRTMLTRDFGKLKAKYILNVELNNVGIPGYTWNIKLIPHSLNKHDCWIDPKSFKLKRVGLCYTRVVLCAYKKL